MNRLCLPLAAAFAAASLVPAAAFADGCRRAGVVYHAPAYHAPAYHAAPEYHAPAYHHQDTVVVSRAFRVLVDPEYYNYSTVTAEVRAQIYKEMYLDQLRREGLKAGESGGVEYPEAPSPAPAPKAPALGPAPKQIPKAAVPPKSVSSSGVDAQLRAVIAAKCVSCHADGANKINLNEDNLAKLSLDQWAKCVRETSKNRMPKGKPPLPDAEFQLFDKQLEKLEALAKK